MSIFSRIATWFRAPSPAPDAPYPKRRQRRPRTAHPVPFKTMAVGDSALIPAVSRRDIASRVNNANRYYSDRKFTYTYNADDDYDSAVVMRIA